MNRPSYMIANAVTLQELTGMINDAIEDGYFIEGSIVDTGGTFMQVLVSGEYLDNYTIVTTPAYSPRY